MEASNRVNSRDVVNEHIHQEAVHNEEDGSSPDECAESLFGTGDRCHWALYESADWQNWISGAHCIAVNNVTRKRRAIITTQDSRKTFWFGRTVADLTL